MSTTPVLIYCAAGAKRLAEIALRHGYQYGAQLPHTIYFPPYFADQDWKKPNREKYMAALAEYRPALATALDWEYEEQLSDVLSWAEEATQYVGDSIIIIPKVVGGIGRLPRLIGGKPVRLGYSASTTFSSTPVHLAAFKGWPVHCLGGSLATQMHVAHHADVRSVDGNYAQRLARYCQVYSPAVPEQRHGWPRLSRLAGIRPIDSIYIAFELSCIAIPMAWRGENGPNIYEAQMAWLESQGLASSIRQLKLEELCS